MDKLFTAVARINSLLFLLVLIGAAAALIWTFADGMRGHRRGAVKVQAPTGDTKETMLLRLESVEAVHGRDVQFMRLTARSNPEKYSGNTGETRNVLFIAGMEGSARWLFPEHDRLVLMLEQVRDDARSSESDRPTRALYVEYIGKDSSADGTLSRADLSTLAIARPDGSAVVDVLHDVERVMSHQLRDERTLSVIYQRGSVVRIAQLALDERKLISDRAIVDLASGGPMPQR